MSYATQQDMERTYGAKVIVQVTGRGSNVLDQAVLQQSIDDADRLINSYLVQRYTLPLTGWRVPVRQACDITMYYLQGSATTESTQKRYDQAVAYLRDVARGVASLESDGTVPPEGDKQDTEIVLQSAAPRVFSGDTLRDY